MSSQINVPQDGSVCMSLSRRDGVMTRILLVDPRIVIMPRVVVANRSP